MRDPSVIIKLENQSEISSEFTESFCSYAVNFNVFRKYRRNLEGFGVNFGDNQVSFFTFK